MTQIGGSGWQMWVTTEQLDYLRLYLSDEELAALCATLRPQRAYRFWRIINARVWQ